MHHQTRGREWEASLRHTRSIRLAAILPGHYKDRNVVIRMDSATPSTTHGSVWRMVDSNQARKHGRQSDPDASCSRRLLGPGYLPSIHRISQQLKRILVWENER